MLTYHESVNPIIENGKQKQKNYIEGECLSTDTKPTVNVANGSKLMEMDTGKFYMFDEADSTWREY